MAMTDTVAQKIMTLLERIDRYDDVPPTTREIAQFYGVTTRQVRTFLGRMEDQGYVRKAGSAANGHRTWAFVRPVDG